MKASSDTETDCADERLSGALDELNTLLNGDDLKVHVLRHNVLGSVADLWLKIVGLGLGLAHTILSHESATLP